VDDALSHPFFKKIRNLELEKSSKDLIEIEFDAKVNKDMSREKLRELMLLEVKMLKEMGNPLYLHTKKHH